MSEVLSSSTSRNSRHRSVTSKRGHVGPTEKGCEESYSGLFGGWWGTKVRILAPEVGRRTRDSCSHGEDLSAKIPDFE